MREYLETTQPSASEASLSGIEPLYVYDLRKYQDGINLKTREPKPFDVNLQDFHTEQEMKLLMDLAGRGTEEAAEIARHNNEVIAQNNATLDHFNDHILDLASMSPQELQDFYQNTQTSDSDKSVIACIEGIRLFYRETPNQFYSTGEYELWDGIERAIDTFDGLKIVEAQTILRQNGAHFQILTKQEREAAGEGPVTDIASAALESFATSPQYRRQNISEYEQYLRGIALDSIKTTNLEAYEPDKIESAIDLEEFQERVMESLSGTILDEDNRDRPRTEAEYRTFQKRAAAMHADQRTGHHFLTEAEERRPFVEVNVGDHTEMRGVYEFEDDKARDKFWKIYRNRVRRNNHEAFAYEKKLATAEAKTQIDKIDLDQLEAINQDKSLSYEEKAQNIATLIQSSYGIRNPDYSNQSRAITVRWFRHKDPKVIEAARKLLKIPKPDDGLLEEGITYAGYYQNSQKSIFLPKPRASKKKLTIEDINTIAHEMWHAKQYDLMEDNSLDGTMSTEEKKKRLYGKNDLDYQGGEFLNYRAYAMQIMEREAFAMGHEITMRLMRRKAQQRGKQVLAIAAATRPSNEQLRQGNL